eukprot:CAMPEP_0184500130 /NCGR_PEP_ID=MMETSP0113_2-20130426/43718_1 /TAXON_ID=91329 /ORGANISM="Norrisiella sphaerica, Strain BC52" /LENGTH=487 /DNA_ID=CAMNT_0026888357 /DNA_START=97 /DNA_END=1560 /DNA_ORIENTATION=+
MKRASISQAKVIEALRKSLGERTHEAEALIAEGRLDYAVAALTSAIFLKPNEAELYRRRAELYVQMCDFKSAYLNYKRVISLSPNDAKSKHRMAGICYVRGKLLLNDEDFHTAEKAFAEAEKLSPTTMEYKMGSVHVMVRKNLLKSALLALNEILSHNQDFIEARLVRAKILIDSREILRAQSDLDIVDKIEADHPQLLRIRESLKNTANALRLEASANLMHGLYNKSLSSLNDSLLLDPRPDTYRLRATVLRHQEKYAESITDLNTALSIIKANEPKVLDKDAKNSKDVDDINKQLAITLNDVGVSLVGMRKYREAITCFRKAMTRNNQLPELPINLGDCYKQLDEFDNALKFYNLAYEMFSIDKTLKEELEDEYKTLLTKLGQLRFERGRRMFNNTNYIRADQEFSEAINLLPQIASLWFHRAEARLHLYDLVGSYLDFEKSTKLDPTFMAAVERFEWIKSKVNPQGPSMPKRGRGKFLARTNRQ